MTAKKSGKNEKSNKHSAPKDTGPAFGIIEVRDVPPENVFRFQLGPALLDQLRAKLESLTPIPLAPDIDAPYPGFYQIIFDGVPKYIGKTQRTVGERLGEHWLTFSKIGVPLDRVTCRFAFVEDLSLVDITEQSLIRYFGERGEAEWNGTGLGSKVSGYGRRGQKASKFVQMFKPDLRREIAAGADKPLTLQQLIRQIDAAAPVHLKIPKAFLRAFNEQFGEKIRVAPTSRAFEEWVAWIEAKIGPTWTVERQPLSWYIVTK